MSAAPPLPEVVRSGTKRSAPAAQASKPEPRPQIDYAPVLFRRPSSDKKIKQADDAAGARTKALAFLAFCEEHLLLAQCDKGQVLYHGTDKKDEHGARLEADAEGRACPRGPAWFSPDASHSLGYALTLDMDGRAEGDGRVFEYSVKKPLRLVDLRPSRYDWKSSIYAAHAEAMKKLGFESEVIEDQGDDVLGEDAARLEYGEGEDDDDDDGLLRGGIMDRLIELLLGPPSAYSDVSLAQAISSWLERGLPAGERIVDGWISFDAENPWTEVVLFWPEEALECTGSEEARDFDQTHGGQFIIDSLLDMALDALEVKDPYVVAHNRRSKAVARTRKQLDARYGNLMENTALAALRVRQFVVLRAGEAGHGEDDGA